MIQDGEAHGDDGCEGHWRRVNNYTVRCDKCGNVCQGRCSKQVIEVRQNIK